ncbi:MAG TPA: hypothetical protein VFW33_23065 [Gemmataceae bacterium]|nr:hypothetical protein [Gemmataceae bacterium]
MSANAVDLGPREYPASVEDLRTALPEVAAEVSAFTGVGQVLDWMQRRGLDLRRIDFVPMDEFEYDFLLEWEWGGRWLAFGVT